MARDLGPRRREPQSSEQAALAALADVPLGVGVRLRACDADRVEPELVSPSHHLGGRHRLIVTLPTIGSSIPWRNHAPARRPSEAARAGLVGEAAEGLRGLWL